MVGKYSTVFSALGIFIFILSLCLSQTCCVVQLALPEFKAILLSLFFFKLFLPVHHLCSQYPQAATGVTDGCEPPCGCWESNWKSDSKAASVLNLMLSQLSSPECEFMFCLHVFLCTTCMSGACGGQEAKRRKHRLPTWK